MISSRTYDNKPSDLPSALLSVVHQTWRLSDTLSLAEFPMDTVPLSFIVELSKMLPEKLQRVRCGLSPRPTD